MFRFCYNSPAGIAPGVVGVYCLGMATDTEGGESMSNQFLWDGYKHADFWFRIGMGETATRNLLRWVAAGQTSSFTRGYAIRVAQG